MIRLPPKDLPEDVRAMLDALQQSVNAAPTYHQRVALGKLLFKTKAGGAAFRPIRRALGEMCSGARRCCYCEDSAATDIEHIWPKDFYPDLVFVWENYLYGCPRCNRPKSNICDIYSHTNGLRVSVSQWVKEHGGPPETGEPVLINPRLEDPLEFMMLELRDTFFFMPLGWRDSRNWERAVHTINLLKLNQEDVLPVARAEAYESYAVRLERYVHQKNHRLSAALPNIVNTIVNMGHPTVWQEMKRQAAKHPRLTELFTEAPEALTW